MEKSLKAAFPQTEIELPFGRAVAMRPLPIKILSKFFDSFWHLFILKEQGLSIVEICSAAYDEVLKLVEPCLLDASTDDLCAPDIPFVLDQWFDHNLPESTRKKWGALAEKVKEAFPEISLEIGTTGSALKEPSSDASSS